MDNTKLVTWLSWPGLYGHLAARLVDLDTADSSASEAFAGDQEYGLAAEGQSAE